MDHFLNKNEVISYLPTFDKSPLIVKNDFWKKAFQSLSHGFSDEHVANVLEGNLHEFFERIGTLLFRYKGQEGRVCVAPKLVAGLRL